MSFAGIIQDFYRDAAAVDWDQTPRRLTSGNVFSAAEVRWLPRTPGGKPRLWSSGRDDAKTAANRHVLTDTVGGRLSVALVPTPQSSPQQTAGLVDALRVSLDHAALIAESAERRLRDVAVAAVTASHRQPMFVVDGDLGVAGMNQTARAAGAQATVHQGTDGKLVISQLGDPDVLRDHVRRLSSGASREAGVIALKDANLAPQELLLITAFPDLAQAIDTELVGGLVVVSCIPLYDLPPVPPHILKAGLDLTTAEAEVANALGSGQSVIEYGTSGRRAMTTVRWHAKNAMLHTGTSSQLELARLMLLLQVFVR